MGSALIILNVQADRLVGVPDKIVSGISELAKAAVQKCPVVFSAQWRSDAGQAPGLWTPPEMFLSPEMIFVRTNQEGDCSAFEGVLTQAVAKVGKKAQNDTLESRLKRLEVDAVFVCGFGAVAATAIDSTLVRGMQATVIEDLSFGFHHAGNLAVETSAIPTINSKDFQP